MKPPYLGSEESSGRRGGGAGLASCMVASCGDAMIEERRKLPLAILLQGVMSTQSDKIASRQGMVEADTLR